MIELPKGANSWADACRLFRVRCSTIDCENMAALRAHIENGSLVVVPLLGVTPELLEQIAFEHADSSKFLNAVQVLRDALRTGPVHGT